jgi:hypothetical protein
MSWEKVCLGSAKIGLILTERYFRALQQVSAHPHCIRLADQAKVHLWALYEHVLDWKTHPASIL